MRRVFMKPRADWRPGLRKYPYGVRAMGAGLRWREDARYEFQAGEIDLIESVADEIHSLIVQAVRSVVERRLLTGLQIPPEATRMIESSWNSYWSGGFAGARSGGLVGRLTFAYDGRDSLRLIACNYDCPDGLFAASVIQRNWLETMVSGGADQFNGLHEALVERWEELLKTNATGGPVHFTCFAPDPEREGELVYLAATAQEAGITTQLLPIQDIGWGEGRFRDLDGQPMGWLCKRHPWEALLDTAFGTHLRAGALTMLEPVWRWVPSLHSFLALLWQLFPGHPNLCRASADSAGLSGVDGVLAREVFGLDDAAWAVFEHGDVVAGSARTPAEGQPLVWLEVPSVYTVGKVHALIDAWVVGDKCLGMTVRESEARYPLGDAAAIMPHLYRP